MAKTELENQQHPRGVTPSLVQPKRGFLEVLLFSYGVTILLTVVPLCIVGLIAILIPFAVAGEKNLSVMLPTAAGLFIKDGGVWASAGIGIWVLLALGSVIYLNCYFPQYRQRPWQRRLTAVVRACGGGAAAFGVVLQLYTLLFKMPGNDEQYLFSREAVIAAFIVGFFCALLAAYWPAWRKGR